MKWKVATLMLSCAALVITIVSSVLLWKHMNRSDLQRYKNMGWTVGFAAGYLDGYLGIEPRGVWLLYTVDYPSFNNLEWGQFNQNFPSGYTEGHNEGASKAEYDKENGTYPIS